MVIDIDLSITDGTLCTNSGPFDPFYVYGAMA